MTENEMVGWHHQLSGREFGQALRDGEGQGYLGCCSPWGHKELHVTERLNNSTIKHNNRNRNRGAFEDSQSSRSGSLDG